MDIKTFKKVAMSKTETLQPAHTGIYKRAYDWSQLGNDIWNNPYARSGIGAFGGGLLGLLLGGKRHRGLGLLLGSALGGAGGYWSPEIWTKIRGLFPEKRKQRPEELLEQTQRDISKRRIGDGPWPLPGFIDPELIELNNDQHTGKAI